MPKPPRGQIGVRPRSTARSRAVWSPTRSSSGPSSAGGYTTTTG
ncbi:hypothetical protein ACFQV2_22700 [Actinokineospora soli]|uniref:Uncharacterized protein n=1 Tax=Actinokineospora soli TaxID=1048753 RepID=A0ABW2TRI4_9PSEU